MRRPSVAFKKSRPDSFILHFRRAIDIGHDACRYQQTVVAVLRE
jgi:hypothetical protein